MIKILTLEDIVNEKFDHIEEKIDNIKNFLTTSLVHRTDTINLISIMKEGLKTEKSLKSYYSSEFYNISNKITNELGISKDRSNAIYATFNTEVPDSNELFARNETLLEFKVDNNDPEIFVANFEPINKAIFNQLDYHRVKQQRNLIELEKNLYEYWISFVSLYEYLTNLTRYKYAEILIFHNIEPNKITILESY